MRKLLIFTLAVIFSLPIFAENEEKYSATTQMFLMEQNGLVKPQVLSRRKSIKNANGTQSPVFERFIVAPEMVNGVRCISSFIRLTDNDDLSELESLGVVVRGKFANGLIVAYIPVDKIEDVAAINKVTRINVGSKMRPLTDKGREYTNTDDVLELTSAAQTAGLPKVYDGSGVLLGITDSGIDFQHIAFKDKDGNYRAVGAYQVQYDEDTEEYTRTEYTKSTMSGATTDDYSDHGTHTCSTAGGSSVILSGTAGQSNFGSTVTVTDNHANATYGGMAPGADLWLAGVGDLNDDDLALSFQKIVNYADEHDMPVVISNSWGSSAGPRDGTGDFADVVAQYFGDNYPNHVCLFASSNDAGSADAENENGGYYVGKTGATSSSPLGTILRNWSQANDPSDAYYGMLAAAWNRSNTSIRCKIYVLNSSTGEILAQTSAITPSTNYYNPTAVSGLSSYYSGSLYVLAQSQNGKQGCYLYTNQLTSKSSGNYTLAVEFYPSSGSTTIDAWGGNNYGWFVGDDFVSTTDHTWTAGTDDMSVSDEATIPNAISVGAYVSKTSWTAYNRSTYSAGGNNLGDIADFSSYATAAKSPTGLQYPWITAPGAQIVSAVNHLSSDYITGDDKGYRVNTNTTYPYAAMQGTSMATPTAAGIVALWLQVAKENGISLTTNQVKEIMAATAQKDTYVMSGSNASHFGNGKIDALAGIEYILENYVSSLDKPELNDAAAVGTDRFTASWSSVQDATSYTLQIEEHPDTPPYATLGDYDFSNGSNNSGGWTKSSSGLTWNNTSGNLTIGSGSATGQVTSPALDFSNYTEATIVLTGAKKNGDVVNVTIGSASGQVSGFTTTSGTHYAVIDISNISNRSSLNVALSATATRKQVELSHCTIYGGDASATLSSSAPRVKAISDNTENGVRTISGITSTSHQVTGLTAGTTYDFKVKAVNSEDESAWSDTKQVTTLDSTDPTLSVSPDALSFTGDIYPESSNEQTFTLSGANLTAGVSLAVSGDNAALFTVSPASLTAAQAAAGATVTVTYAPTAVGSHSATVTATSTGADPVTVSLTGTCVAAPLVVYDPVMQTATAAQIGSTSFTATWTDETDAANVSSYTLYVNKEEEQTTTTVDDVLNNANTINSTQTQYKTWTSNGTSGAVYAGQSAGGNSAIQIRSDNSNSGIVSTTSGGKIKKVSVSWQTTGTRTLNVYGKSSAYSAATDLYNSSNQGTLLGTISNAQDGELEIDGDYEYIGVRSSSGALYMSSITFTWEQTASGGSSAPRLKAVSGDADNGGLTVTEIPANTKSYEVTGLTAGATYNYKVKAKYSDNSESDWSNTEQVTLEGGAPTPELTADATVNISATVGQSNTGTFDVLGENLTGNVTLTLSDESGFFSLDKNSITPSNGDVDETVTVTYAPQAAGSHSATVTITSDGAQLVTVALNGTATGPVLEVDPTSLSFEAFVNDDDSKTVALSGENLTGNVTLTLSGDNAAMFSLSDNSFTPSEGEVLEDVTVTYAPTAAGNHSATLTISSTGAQSVTVSLTGTASLYTEVPVMQPATAVQIGSTSFTATWTDETPAANVSSYTLYVNKQEEQTTTTVDDVLNNANTVNSTEQNYTEWTLTGTSGAGYSGQSAGKSSTIQLRSNGSNSGIVTTTSGGKVKKVVVDWNSDETSSGRTLNVYGKSSAYSAPTDLYGNNAGTLIGTIVYGTSTELAISDDYEYIGVRSASGALYMNSITFTWEQTASASSAPRLMAVEEGDADDGGLTVTGITSKSYEVTGLTAGATYNYKVKAVYSDNSESDWSNTEQVTLNDDAPSLAVDPASLTFDALYTGASSQKTFTVTGANLTQAVTLTATGDYFTVSPATLTPENGAINATVTVTYAPTAVGSHSGNIALTSSEVTTVNVELSGSASLQKEVPVMVEATAEQIGSTSFTATWTDETPAANVSSYTLFVNKQEETPVLVETTVYEKVTDETTLADGDKIIIVDETANKADGAIASNNNGSWLSAIDVTISDSKIDIDGKSVKVLTLEADDNNWKIKDSEGQYLTCTTAKYITLGSTGTATTISISDGDATISFGSSQGRILYNQGSPRFTTYTSNTSSSMRLPQIYRVTYASGGSSAPRLKAVEEGDADDGGLTVTEIPANTKSYEVTGLTAGATYSYKVKAVYSDETESDWSNTEQVTLNTVATHSLAEMVADGTLSAGDDYAITDGNLLAVYRSQDGKTLFCKDEGEYASPVEAAAGQTDYMKEYGKDVNLRTAGDYDQSNWVALKSSTAFSADLVGYYLNGVSGTIDNLSNPAITVTEHPTAGEAATKPYLDEANVFIPSSFGTSTAVVVGENTFFFMSPKPMEVGVVTWACWDGTKFVDVPKQGTMNPYGLNASLTINSDYLSTAPSPEVNTVYNFVALITRESSGSSAPRLKDATAGGYGVYPLGDLTSMGTISPVTGIISLFAGDREVKAVRYIDLMGRVSDTPSRGINIVEIEFTDGSRTTTKVRM